MKVGILGGGQWGQALARLVIAAGNEPYVAYVGKRPPHVLPSTDVPAKVPAACDLVLVATSAAEVRQAIRDAKPGAGNRILVAGRGLEPSTSRWPTRGRSARGSTRRRLTPRRARAPPTAASWPGSSTPWCAALPCPPTW